MAKEIEKKFLVKKELWQRPAKGIKIAQGYLCSDKKRVVRVRIADQKAFITIKGENNGIERLEYEYDIPVKDAEEMLSLCEKPLVEKTRYLLTEVDGHLWEVDEFYGDNEGLLVAEIELKNPDEEFKLPSWAGEDVSLDVRYYNANLRKNPYKLWKK